MKKSIHFLHYLVEILSVLSITFITIAYLVTGYYDTPIILGAFTTILAIAAAESYRKHKEPKL